MSARNMRGQRRGAGALDGCEGAGVHQPGCGVAGFVVPDDIVGAVAVEVTGAHDVRGQWRRSDGCDRGDLAPVHQPERNLTEVVAPQDVVAAVAVEVAGG